MHAAPAPSAHLHHGRHRPYRHHDHRHARQKPLRLLWGRTLQEGAEVCPALQLRPYRHFKLPDVAWRPICRANWAGSSQWRRLPARHAVLLPCNASVSSERLSASSVVPECYRRGGAAAGSSESKQSAPLPPAPPGSGGAPACAPAAAARHWEVDTFSVCGSKGFTNLRAGRQGRSLQVSASRGDFISLSRAPHPTRHSHVRAVPAQAPGAPAAAAAVHEVVIAPVHVLLLGLGEGAGGALHLHVVFLEGC